MNLRPSLYLPIAALGKGKYWMRRVSCLLRDVVPWLCFRSVRVLFIAGTVLKFAG